MPIWAFHSQISPRISVERTLAGAEPGRATGSTFCTNASFTSGRVAFSGTNAFMTPGVGIQPYSAALRSPKIKSATARIIRIIFGPVLRRAIVSNFLPYTTLAGNLMPYLGYFDGSPKTALLEHVAVIAGAAGCRGWVAGLRRRNGGRRCRCARQQECRIGISRSQQLLLVGIQFLQGLGLDRAVLQIDGIHEVLGQPLEVFHFAQFAPR